jgi:hypothetical protein
MGAITGTLAKATEFAGEYKLICLTATVASASDTITLTLADHGITEIVALVGLVITGGQDAAFTAVSASFDGLVLTVTSVEQDGTAATDFTGTTIAVTVLGQQ